MQDIADIDISLLLHELSPATPPLSPPMS